MWPESLVTASALHKDATGRNRECIFCARIFRICFIVVLDLIGDVVKPSLIYKILRQPEWKRFQETGIFLGSTDDRRDGFIHLSTSAQLQGTLDKHYMQGDMIIIAEVNVSGLGQALKYEVSRGGAEFPHLYDQLLIDNVSRHWDLSPNEQGRYAVYSILTD